MIDIAAERKKFKLSQTELAKRAGITQPGLCLIERGKACPRKRTLDSIMHAIEAEGRKHAIEADQKQAEVKIVHVTNGDMLRRRIISDADLISNGRVKCAGDRATCSGVCSRCKSEWLRQPYETGTELST